MLHKESKARDTKAVVIGRFQPMHKGHLEAIRRILRKCGRLTIFIGSSQEKRTKRNPLSAKERRQMMKFAIGKLAGKVTFIDLQDTFNNATWTASVLKKAGKFDALYSNNALVRSLFRPYCNVHWMKSGIRINSTKIREMIRMGNKRWKEWVPKEVEYYLKKYHLLKAFE